jgi:hypothetical protein
MNIELGVCVGRSHERGLRDVNTVVAPSRLHPPNVDDSESQRRARRTRHGHTVDLIAGAVAIAYHKGYGFAERVRVGLLQRRAA